MFGTSGNTIRAANGWFEFRESEKRRFLAEGLQYTRGYLDGRRGLTKLWLLIIGDATYYGAREARKSFGQK